MSSQFPPKGQQVRASRGMAHLALAWVSSMVVTCAHVGILHTDS